MAVKAAYSQTLTYNASEMRAAQGALLASTSLTTSILPRDGCLPDGVNPLAVSAGGSMNLTVNMGQASVAGYVVTNDATATVAVSTSGATARTDLLILRVYDTEAGDAVSKAQLEMVTGTSVSVPATPARSLVLAQIAVGASVSSIISANITDRRVYTSSSGGLIIIPGAFATPALASGLADGTPVWDSTALLLGVKVGAQVLPPMNAYTPAFNQAIGSRNAAQNLGPSTWTPQSLGTTELVTGSGLGVGPSGIACGFTGWIQAEGFVTFSGNPGGARRAIGLGPTSGSAPNISNPINAPINSSSPMTLAMTETFAVTIGDVITVWAFHDIAGVTLTTSYKKIVVRRVA